MSWRLDLTGNALETLKGLVLSTCIAVLVTFTTAAPKPPPFTHLDPSGILGAKQFIPHAVALRRCHQLLTTIPFNNVSANVTLKLNFASRVKLYLQARLYLQSSIFDIPLILDTICNHLSKQALLDRVALIRSLTIDISNAGWFLNNLKPCTKLSELHCADLENLLKPPKTNPVALSPIVDQTNNPLLMIGANPNLHTLTFEKINWQYRADHFTESVFRFLVTHKSAHST
ncbi:hypothetical protein F5H01DRAFT_385468 [Linnemannia elongata]|nr:hypothetical protein F5H01DRAFT_385468 [Linnemannia elongata]